METSLFNRLQATLLALATAGLFVLAVLNLQQERQFQQPDDGVWWREASGGLHGRKSSARHVRPSAPASSPTTCSPASPVAPHATIPPVTRLSDLERALYRTGSYGQVYYTITRDGIPLDTPVKVIPEPSGPQPEQGSASSA